MSYFFRDYNTLIILSLFHIRDKRSHIASALSRWKNQESILKKFNNFRQMLLSTQLSCDSLLYVQTILFDYKYTSFIFFVTDHSFLTSIGESSFMLKNTNFTSRRCHSHTEIAPFHTSSSLLFIHPMWHSKTTKSCHKQMIF